MPDPLKVRAIAETWEHRRRNAVDASQVGATDNLRDWAETMNAQTRLLISELQLFDPDAWQQLAGVCQLRATGVSLIGPALATFRPYADAFALVEHPKLWDALEELTHHAATMTDPHSKFIVNKLDRTNL